VERRSDRVQDELVDERAVFSVVTATALDVSGSAESLQKPRVSFARARWRCAHQCPCPRRRPERYRLEPIRHGVHDEPRASAYKPDCLRAV